MSASSNHIQLLAGGRDVLFAFRIPHLPDFLLDHTLLGEEPSERIVEHCRRWVQFVGSLWRSDGLQRSTARMGESVTYVLRFDWNPGVDRSGIIRVTFWGRVGFGPQTQAVPQRNEYARALAEDVFRAMEAFGIEPERIGPLEFEQQRDLPGNHCYEVSQREYIVPVMQPSDLAPPELELPASFTLPGSGDVRQLFGIQPWWGPGGAYLVPFRTLVAQRCRVSLCVVLQPTALSDFEQAELARASRNLESLAQLQTKPSESGAGQILHPSQNRTDPQMRWLARTYAANLRRLSEPFLAAAFCLADQPTAALQVASALATTIREEQAFESPVGESEPLHSAALVLSCSAALARTICKDVDFKLHDKLETLAPHKDLRRLRYLVDARGAATAFRLPVSVRGGVPGIGVKQMPPDFHPGPRVEAQPRMIRLGRFHMGGEAALPPKAFTKHALVTGFTGSGKTTTVLNLLHQFWHLPRTTGASPCGPNGGGIPFLVIESAKHEYRGLLRVQGFHGQRAGQPILRVYTAGNELCAPLRINPFQLLPGVRLESHVNRLLACFQAALPPLGPLPSILAETIELVYKRYGWTLTAIGPGPNALEPRSFPTLGDLYELVEGVIDGRKYTGELLTNLKAATRGRIRTLLLGSMGAMFSERRISDPGALFRHPTIIELNDLNHDDKALVMMFLLMLLREHREQEPGNDLVHLTVVEEAHNVLGRVESVGSVDGGGADVKAKSVEAFGNMLAEVRALGQGLIIADQSPNKLAPDAMRNTNVQIAHQLRDGHDREAIANAMVMDDEQRDYLAKLEPGRAAVFYTSLQKATYLEVPKYVPDGPEDARQAGESEADWRLRFPGVGFAQVSDAEVSAHMDPLVTRYRRPVLPYSSCEHCTSQCRYGEKMRTLATDDTLDIMFQKAHMCLTDARYRERLGLHHFGDYWRLLLRATGEAAKSAGAPGDIDAAWCFLVHKTMRYRRNAPYLDAGERTEFARGFAVWAPSEKNERPSAQGTNAFTRGEPSSA